MVSNVFFFSAVAAAILSPSHCVSAIAGIVTVPLCNYECYSMRHLFEGRFYFASLFAKSGVNSRGGTKQAQKELTPTEDLHSIFLCRSAFLDPLQAIVVCMCTCQEHVFRLEFSRNQTCMHPIKILYYIANVKLFCVCMACTAF